MSSWPARRRVGTAVLLMVGLLLSVVAIVGARHNAQALDTPEARTFTNPLVDNGADPWMTWYEGNYYLAYTTWNSQMVMRKAPTVDGLKTAKPVVIWSDTTPARCCNFWAPEFRLLTVDGTKRWYFTFTAGSTGTFGDQRTMVLQSAGLDPMGPYEFKGRVADPEHDGFAIDGSYLELNNSLYYVWSAFDGPQNLYIAKMANPWTISGTRSLLSTPQHDWEKAGDPVNEGPVAISRGGRTFLFYAAGACNTPDYKLGRLTFTGGDPLQTSSWSKSATPAFSRNDSAKAYGPGHNGFFTSPDGTEDWIVYHANPQAYENKDENCGSHRSTRIQKVRWTSDGTPDLGSPVALGDAITVPSGENAPMKADVSVQGMAYNLVNIFSDKCLETTLGVRNDNANVAQRSCASGSGAQTQQWTLDANGDGTYRMINRNSRKALSVLGCGKGDGANVVQAAWTGTACQSWKLTPTANGYVRIDEPTSGKTLDVANCFTSEDVDVRLWTWIDGSPCQQWRLQPVGQAAINNVNSGKLLGTSCGPADGTPVTLRFYDRSLCEGWTFTSAGGGAYTIRNGSRQCLGVRDGATTDSAPTDVRSCSDAKDQQWHLMPQADGTFRLANVGTGRSLDIDGCGLADGTTVGQYTWLDNDCQRFRLTALEPIRYPTPVGPLYPTDPRTVTGDINVHDPALAKGPDGTYVLASTGKYVSILTSPDGYGWTYAGPAFDDKTGTPWARPYLTDNDGKVSDWLWAPDISYHNGRYYMYYSASTFGSQHSAIFLATSETGAPGTWTPADSNGGKVVESGAGDPFNAIDPNLFVDADGSWWMTFGSWWSGIKMVRLDPRTGLRDAGDQGIRSLAGRSDQPGGNQAVEGPYLVRHDGKYYLFVAYDVCCNGVNSTYRIMVGRADTVTGPYRDADGRAMTDGFATQVLAGHDNVPGPGHQAVFHDGDRDLLVYHHYGTDGIGKLGINPLKWVSNGSGAWPVVAPDPGRPGKPTPSPTESSPVPSPTVSASTSAPSPTPPTDAGCAASLRVESGWDTGFTATVTVTNRGNSAMTGWRVTWAWPSGQQVTNAWNGTLTQTGSTVSVTNLSWNGSMASGAATTFGFQASGSGATPTLTCTRS